MKGGPKNCFAYVMIRGKSGPGCWCPCSHMLDMITKQSMCFSCPGGVSAEEGQQCDAGGADLCGAGGVSDTGHRTEGRSERLELSGRGERGRRESRTGRREHRCGCGEGLQGDGGERVEGGAIISSTRSI